jgi:hypothetical protein
MMVFLTQNLHISFMNLGSIEAGMSVAEESRYRSSIYPKQTFEMPLHNQKICVWCAITVT